MKRALVVPALIAALAACRNEAGELFELSGRVFVFNPRVATATYVVTLRTLERAPEGAVAVAEFEDPAGGAPIVAEQKIWPGAAKVALESPPVYCIVKDRHYGVAIRIVAADGVVLQRLETTIVSTLDQSVMPDKPLVVGPAYDPNPDVAGRPDGKVGGGPACPARG